MQNQSIVMAAIANTALSISARKPSLFAGMVTLSNAESIGDIVEIRFPLTFDATVAELQVRGLLADRGLFPTTTMANPSTVFVNYEFSSIRGEDVVVTRSLEEPGTRLFTILPPEN